MKGDKCGAADFFTVVARSGRGGQTGTMPVAASAAIAADPEWLAHRFDPGADAFHFRHVPRSVHRAVTFLTDDYLPAGETVVIGRREAIAAAPPAGPVHFIFHSAFCLSTVLTRAFDLPGVAMGLKEPVLLNDLSGWRQRGGKGRDIAEVLDNGMALLARPFGPGEATVIKPSNVATAFYVAMLAMRPGAKALLLHAPLETYLQSVAKKGMDGRLWARDLLVKLLRDGLVDLGFKQEDYVGLTDLQAAAVGWLAQHQLFAALTVRFPGRVRSLDSETLLARPAATMAALADLFGLEFDAAGVAAGPAFSSHSKTGAAFGAAARAAEYDAAAAAHGDEIAKVAVWAAAVAANAGVAIDLPERLLSQ